MKPEELSFWTGLALIGGGLVAGVAGVVFPPLGPALLPSAGLSVTSGIGILAASKSGPPTPPAGPNGSSATKR